MTHHLKTVQPFFEQVYDGIKKFEIRLNDRDFHVHDWLVLREYDDFTDTYTGREIETQVIYILSGFPAIKPGWCVMGLGNVLYKRDTHVTP